MKATHTVALAGALLTFIVSPGGAQNSKDWVDIKDPDALRALFSDKTHRSRAYVAHFRADGEGILIPQGSDIRNARTWRLKGNDQVCAGAKGDDTPTCYRYQRSTKNPAEILAIGERRGQSVMQWFTVEDGIPKF
jgi:hypothetical protein